MSRQETMRVAIVGLGAVGLEIARALDAGIEGFTLAAVSARDIAAAQARLAGFRNPVPVVAADALEPLADLLIECAPASLLADVTRPFLAKGKDVVLLSVGALVDHPDLVDLARTNGAQILVPSGAMLGLDAVAAAAQGKISSVRLVTRKPVQSFESAPFLKERGIALSGIDAPLQLFAGTAREAAKHFPANLNVAAALGLAGIGVDRTMIEIWADPGVTRNIHSVEVVSDSAQFSMTIENMPSENPKTSRITALSVLALLRKMRAPLRIGS